VFYDIDDVPYGIGMRPRVVALKSLALSLSDQYWLNPEGALDWHDVNFFENPFSEDVGDLLFGHWRAENGGKLDLMSPDNTLDGWLKKRWKIIDGDRCLIKGGSKPYQLEPLNEAVATCILDRLQTAIPFVKYETITFETDKYGVEEISIYSVCKNFVTPDTELVPAWQVLIGARGAEGRVELQALIDRCIDIGLGDIRGYMDFLLAFDYLILNTDRHLNNFGFIRDVNTLEFLGPAPIYDNGTSLWCKVADFRVHGSVNYATKPFAKSSEAQLGLVSGFDGFDISKLVGIEEELEQILGKGGLVERGRIETITSAFKERRCLMGRAIEGKSGTCNVPRPSCSAPRRPR
jgi:hypothetical protein